MNITELLTNLQARHDAATTQAGELRDLLGTLTADPALNVTRSRLGRLTRQGFLTQPGRGRYQKRT
ncbi:hypothetical protein [Streptomyces hawaiiensis]|uniref:hypothetical protein n=1 Tax=Streptomyces hawaiiensis TaxID=67305 RepID=UPI001FE969BF|nr:hypothetical protein [Streptomyces hawaiiensis]